MPRRAFFETCIGASIFSSNVYALSNTERYELRPIIEKSLLTLASTQNEDGSFGKSTELFGGDPAISSLVGLTFLAAGSLPGRGTYGYQLTQIVQNLLRHSLLQAEDPDSPLPAVNNSTARFLKSNNLSLKSIEGLIVNPSVKGQKTLYGHGYATLFLAEIFGTTSQLNFHHKLEAAKNLIVNTQNQEGGWRYLPNQATIADISVTTCLLAALRACQKAGFFVPQDTIDQAISYICKLQNPDGGFRYMSSSGPSGYARSAAAIHVLQICSDKKQEIDKGIQYLKARYLESPPISSIDYWTYGQFYAALVLQREYLQNNNRLWNDFIKRVTDDLLRRRSSNGLWTSTISSEIETAFALCTLLTIKEGSPLFLCCS